VTNDKEYLKYGATMHVPHSIEYGIEKFSPELLEDDVCYIYGDCYFTEEAIKTIVETNTNKIAAFCRRKPSEINNKPYGEMFAFKIHNSIYWKEVFDMLLNKEKSGFAFEIASGGWLLYDNLIEKEDIQIDDRTEDFDYPYDYDNWMKAGNR
jgi:hypothetical protein